MSCAYGRPNGHPDLASTIVVQDLDFVSQKRLYKTKIGFATLGEPN